MINKIKHFHHQTFSSLKIRNYKLYFIGQAISLCGTWMQTIAQSWLVLTMTNSGTALGFLAAAQFLPILILGPWGGLIADRFPKRKLMYVTQSSSGLLALILGLLVATGSTQLWMVYVLAAALGIITAIDNPTRQIFISEMVGKDQLTNAVSLNSVQFNLARVVGPAIAGAVIATAGIAPCFILNAISFIAVLTALYMMDENELRPSVLVPRARGQLIAGLKYINSQPVLKNTLLMMLIIGTLSYEFSVSLPLLAQFTFHGNAATYAALTSAMGVGSIFGGLYSANRKKISQQLLVLSAFLFGISMIISSVAPNITLALITLAIVGVLSINLTSLGNTTLQLQSAPEMRGRVMSLWAVAFLGSTPIGGPIIGYVCQYFNPRWGLAVGGIAAAVAAGIGWTMMRKKVVSRL